ncbi:YdcF family protein [Devosia sp.]|uniref:YdcF family protein n=1 Tax=Devosia sp. TaxID=1871048 RepID=UPI003A8F0231
MLPLDARARRLITELVFPPAAPARADYTIVLGMTLWKNPLAAALQLHDQQIAGKLIFTGGYNARIGRPEAMAMAEAALAHGVPPDRVLCEPRARHTGENIAFSWAMVAALPYRVEAVNVVGISYHVTRALITARTVVPDTVALGHQGYPSQYFGPDDWHLTARGRRDVLGEVAKLGRYFPHALPPELREQRCAS